MMPETPAAVFAAVAVLLALGHTVGDTAARSAAAALGRVAPALALHPATGAVVATATTAAVLVPALLVLGLDVSGRGVLLGLVVLGLGRVLVARTAVPAAALVGAGVVFAPPPRDADRVWHLVWVAVAALITAGFTTTV